MSVRYHNSNTGDIVTLPGPNRRLDRLPNWQRLDIDAPPKPAPVRESELKGVRKADLQAIAADKGLSVEGSKSELIARIQAASAAIEPASVGGAGASLPSPDAPDPA